MQLTSEIQELADELGETEAKPLRDLQRVVTALGVEQARAMVAQATELNTTGTMMTEDGARQRTLGGVFFKLARDRIGITPPPPRFRRLRWSEATELAREAEAERGEATRVKVTLIGRPGKIAKQDSVVVTTMYNCKRPTLPKQLPKLSGHDVETPYTIFIAAKQWRKVADALTDRDDQLIIEGYCFLDPAIKGICVFAQRTTTKLLQRAQREQQRAKVEQPK